jgi:hypothetical protein
LNQWVRQIDALMRNNTGWTGNATKPFFDG